MTLSRPPFAAAPLLALWMLLGPAGAEAGRRAFLTLDDTEILPEGDLELEQWLYVMRPPPVAPNKDETTWLWWGPVLAPTSHLEVAVPIQLFANPVHVWLESFDVDLRWRVFAREDLRPLQPLLRVAYHQTVGQFTHQQVWLPPRVDAEGVLSYQTAMGLHLVANAGVQLDLSSLVDAIRHPEGVRSLILGTYGLGAEYPFLEGELKLALEATGERAFQGSTRPNRYYAGGSVSWTRGRIWLTAGAQLGLTPNAPAWVPRLVWAVAL